jgi:hypothetical protein
LQASGTSGFLRIASARLHWRFIDAPNSNLRRRYNGLQIIIERYLKVCTTPAQVNVVLICAVQRAYFEHQ